MYLNSLYLLIFLIDSRVAPRRHERGKRLWFEIVESPDTDSIVDAELRLYQVSILNLYIKFFLKK